MCAPRLMTKLMGYKKSTRNSTKYVDNLIVQVHAKHKSGRVYFMLYNHRTNYRVSRASYFF